MIFKFCLTVLVLLFFVFIILLENNSGKNRATNNIVNGLEAITEVGYGIYILENC